MMCLGKVDVLHHHQRELRSASWRIYMPSVIRLRGYVCRRRARIALSRRNVFHRDRHRCQYCSAGLSAREATCDHVTPRSQGGGSSWENLVTACAPCNRRKGGRTPEQAHMPLTRRPERPKSLPVELMINVGAEPPDAWRKFLGHTLPLGS